VTRTRLDSEERRRAIVEAAMPLFARKGFAGATTKEIARAAGVSEALVFQHFPSKAALYQEILRQGCLGDPALEGLASLPPSTATLVRMVEFMIGHFVLDDCDSPEERDTRHRLVVHSYLGDGEYACLLHGWVMERIYPLFVASLEAARRAGDLRPGARTAPANDFWFAQHVAACVAYSRLPGRDAVPHEGDVRAVTADAARFVLRGLGLADEAIARHQNETSAAHVEPIAA
jgi:TetR/AcrR family transcriptional regulator, transcriptional repressor of aconitase